MAGLYDLLNNLFSNKLGTVFVIFADNVHDLNSQAQVQDKIRTIWLQKQYLVKSC